MKVFVCDPIWPDLITPQNKSLLTQANIEIILSTQPASLSEFSELFEESEERILAINPDYVDWSLPADKFKDIPNLKAIIAQATSYGWIDNAYAAERGIPVVNVRNYSAGAVAEWAIMMLFNVARKIPLLIKNGFPLNFASDFQTYQGINLQGKKAGIIGLGNIGSAIAERCQGLGMEVFYWSKSLKKNGYKSCDLETLFRECDVIFPAMSDNGKTKEIITDAMIQSMKPEAMMISIVRGLYNHEMVIEKVLNKSLYGYGFEGDPESFATYKGNIWAAPTYAWCTDTSLRNLMDAFVQAIVDAAQGHYPNKVN